MFVSDNRANISGGISTLKPVVHAGGGNSAPVFVASGSSPGGDIIRVSTNAAGAPANTNSLRPVFSPDGTKVVFQTVASNLAAGDSNGESDVFIKDLATGAITWVSTTSSGGAANGISSQAVFSPDGTKVAFTSTASNLVAGDTNHTADIFIKDLISGNIVRASVNGAGVEGVGESSNPVFSQDGTKLAFQRGDSIFVKNLVTGGLVRISANDAGVQANNACNNPSFSPDGTKIMFVSWATNLVASDTNGRQDIFIKDLTTGVVTLVSTNASGGQGNGNSVFATFSPDGSKIVFESSASNLVGGDTNNRSDIFVKDLATGVVTRVSADQSGIGANDASHLDLFSPDNTSFSPDGTKVVFASFATNLVAGDTNHDYDIFIKDLITGAVTRVSTDVSGQQALGRSLNSVFSRDGGSVVFESDATNLVPGEIGNSTDIFVKSLYNHGGSVVEDGVTSATGKLAFSDANASDTHTVSVGALAPGTLGFLTASLVRDSTGGVTGELSWSYNVNNAVIQSLGAGETRVDTFTVIVNDGTTTTSQTVSVTIHGTDNHRPALTAPPATFANGTEDLAYNFTAAALLTGYSDGDGDPLTVANVAVDHATLTDNHDGTYTVTPVANYHGVVHLTYTINDGDSTSVAVTRDIVFDQVVETIVSPVSYTLAPYVENLRLTGTSAASATGNDSDNVIKGNNGGNVLHGLGGNDYLNGSAGLDTLYGGAGNDTYVVDNSADIVSEATSGGIDDGGVDSVVAFASFVLGDFLEKLILKGTADIDGTGNALDNLIVGNEGVNHLNGAGGKDILIGQAGDDVLTGGAGADQFRFGQAGLANGVDHLTDFTSGTDRLAFLTTDYGFAKGHVLTAAEFHTGSAVGTSAQFLYDTGSHTLYWDADGAGGAVALAIAVFDNAAAPVSRDFVFL